MGKDRCAVDACLSTKGDGESSFFKIPSDTDARKHWEIFLQGANQRGAVRLTSLLCGKHFSTSCVHESLKRRSVKEGHFPTLLNGEKVADCPGCHYVSPQALSFDVPSEVTNCSFDWPKEYKAVRELLNVQTDLNAELQANVELLETKVKNAEGLIREYRNDLRTLHQKLKRKEEALEKKRKREEEEEGSKKPRTDKGPSTADVLVEELSTRLALRNTKGFEFSGLLRDFSFQLHYFSPRAYEFVRKSFMNALPHPCNFLRWSDHIEVNPGFINASLEFIRSRVKSAPHKLYFALSFDEMNIRQQYTSDGKVVKGTVDFGNLAYLKESWVEDIAEKAFFIMAAEINGHHRMPIGYILTKRLDAEVVSNVTTKVLTKLHQCGARVLTITFDGLRVNYAAMEKLGAEFSVEDDDFTPFIAHPCTGESVYMFPDPVHNLKLFRNALHAYREFESNGEKIKWKYIQSLMELQSAEGLRAANKLTTRHVHFQQQKMKVNLAAQTVSNSTAISLEVCEKLMIEQFEGAGPTANLFKMVDRVFDSLNSKSGGKTFKAPLRASNKVFWNALFVKARTLLLSLTAVVKIKVGKKKKETKWVKKKLLHTNRGTCVRGLLTCMRTLQLMMEEIEFGSMPGLFYIPCYKLCQDVIELFFSTIRARYGRNDNPNSEQLRAAVRNVICMKLSVKLSGNCEFEDFETRVSPLGNFKKLQNPDTPDYEINAADSDCLEDDMLSETSLSLFACNIVVYISGKVGRMVCKALTCSSCLVALLCTDPEALKSRNDGVLIGMKDNGGLFLPSDDLIYVCQTTEIEIRRYPKVTTLNRPTVVRSVLSICTEFGVFGGLRTENSEDHPLFGDHVFKLVKSIAEAYFSIRIRYLAKDRTLKINPKTKRSVCTKIIHFGGG